MHFFTHLMSALGGWRALALVFALPALEASAFVGFVFPGETAVVLGGVIASQHKVGLGWVIAAAIAGAVVGDSVGFAIGRRWGDAMVNGTIGRFVKRRSIERARRYVAARGGRAVFFGRWVAALRVLVPGTAGMAGMDYLTFLAFNVSGGAIWATGFVLLGYVAGTGYEHFLKVADRIGLGVLATLVVVGVVVWVMVRRRGESFGDDEDGNADGGDGDG